MATQTKKQIAAGPRRSLKAMRAKLLDMAAAWDEVDQYYLNILDEAAEKLNAVHAALGEIPEEE